MENISSYSDIAIIDASNESLTVGN